MSKEDQGLFKKYQVFRDGVEVKDNVFVLNLDSDEAARKLALDYSVYVGNKQLKSDLKEFYKKNNYSCSYWNIWKNAIRRIKNGNELF